MFHLGKRIIIFKSAGDDRFQEGSWLIFESFTPHGSFTHMDHGLGVRLRSRIVAQPQKSRVSIELVEKNQPTKQGNSFGFLELTVPSLKLTLGT